MNPSKPGAKIRVSISGKVAGGAGSMVRLAGYKLPGSYHAWLGEPILINALTGQWRDDVSVEITLPAEADIREVVLYRRGNTGTVWYGNVSVIPVDVPSDGIDVSNRVRGTLPMITKNVSQRPVRFIYSDRSEQTYGSGLPRMQVKVIQPAR